MSSRLSKTTANDGYQRLLQLAESSGMSPAHARAHVRTTHPLAYRNWEQCGRPTRKEWLARQGDGRALTSPDPPDEDTHSPIRRDGSVWKFWDLVKALTREKGGFDQQKAKENVQRFWPEVYAAWLAEGCRTRA